MPLSRSKLQKAFYDSSSRTGLLTETFDKNAIADIPLAWADVIGNYMTGLTTAALTTPERKTVIAATATALLGMDVLPSTTEIFATRLTAGITACVTSVATLGTAHAIFVIVIPTTPLYPAILAILKAQAAASKVMPPGGEHAFLNAAAAAYASAINTWARTGTWTNSSSGATGSWV